uniref:Uncharacterized protein n=1 Tax=Tetranychus urticae TaxID=32264 RepID=T1JUC5_TETUR
MSNFKVAILTGIVLIWKDFGLNRELGTR